MKPILDACCGGKMFYFDKNDPRVLFQDIREVKTTLCDGRKFEVKPDVQADFTSMPYPDNHFRMVVFDPPHLLRNVGKSKMADMYGSLNEKAQPTGYQHIKYGALYSDWRDMLRRGFAECFRVLMPGGFLIFKWNETDIRVSEVLKLTDLTLQSVVKTTRRLLSFCGLPSNVLTSVKRKEANHAMQTAAHLLSIFFATLRQSTPIIFRLKMSRSLCLGGLLTKMAVRCQKTVAGAMFGGLTR